MQLPPYDGFVSMRRQIVPSTVLELYGNYSASAGGRKISSGFNLLLQPGENAYLEILDPSKQLIYAVSLNREQVTLLWAKDDVYIQEPATPNSLNAIAGLPVLPDDLMLLVAGFGLNFPEWNLNNPTSSGWTLQRDGFAAAVTMRERLSKIQIESTFSPPLETVYEDYREEDNKSLPARIEFEVPKREIELKLRIQKYIPRDEPATPDLFEVKLPANARKISLDEIYKGKPLILQ